MAKAKPKLSQSFKLRGKMNGFVNSKKKLSLLYLSKEIEASLVNFVSLTLQKGIVID